MEGNHILRGYETLTKTTPCGEPQSRYWVYTFWQFGFNHAVRKLPRRKMSEKGAVLTKHFNIPSLPHLHGHAQYGSNASRFQGQVNLSKRLGFCLTWEVHIKGTLVKTRSKWIMDKIQVVAASCSTATRGVVGPERIFFLPCPRTLAFLSC